MNSPSRQKRCSLSAVWCRSIPVLIALAFCSCASLRTDSAANHLAGNTEVGRQSLAPSTNSAPRTFARQGESSGIVQVGYGDEHVDPAVTFTAMEARVPLDERPVEYQTQCQFGCPTEQCPHSHPALAGQWPANPDPVGPDAHPDEYLFDGGDRDNPIHYSNVYRLGVDTEDTIAEFTDHTGDRHVKASNRVAIYSPRFGAVRTVSSPHAGSSVRHIADASMLQHGVGLGSQTVPVFHQSNDRLKDVRMRSRVSGLEGEQARDAVHQGVALGSHSKLINVYQDLAFVRFGQFKQSEEAFLAEGMQAAQYWSRAQTPVILAEQESASEVLATFDAAELIGREPKAKRRGVLQIVKLADRKNASPGDVITFTIRYDNIGERELHHIRIVDNLTPRLEYVEDSETSDRAGNLVLEDNGEGSIILRFELDDPLPGKRGGVVTFQARVR